MTNHFSSGSEKSRMIFWDHLEELRRRILFLLLSIGVLSAAVYFLASDSLLSFLMRPLVSLGQKVYFQSLYGAFLVKLQVSFWSGLFLAMPLIVAHAWFFIAPGLYQNEKKLFLLLLLSSVLMFAFGAGLAFFIVMPAALSFFLGFSTSELQPLLSAGKYLGFVCWMTLVFGLGFEMPIALIGLLRIGVFRIEQLHLARPYVVVGVFLFAAIVTPSADPLSQCLLAVPLWLLFEASLLLGAILTRPGKQTGK